MKTTTREILMAAWARNEDLCDVLANCIEHQEGWDGVQALWNNPPQWAWRVYQEAYQAEWG